MCHYSLSQLNLFMLKIKYDTLSRSKLSYLYKHIYVHKKIYNIHIYMKCITRIYKIFYTKSWREVSMKVVEKIARIKVIIQKYELLLPHKREKATRKLRKKYN